MAIPAEQLNPLARKLSSKKRRTKKHKVRAQTGTKPPSTGPPSKRPPFGHPKPQAPTTSSQRVLDYEGLRAKGIHYHPNYLRRLWYANKFPAPFYPTPRRLAWYEDVIDEWLKAAAGGAAGEPGATDQETAALLSTLAALDPDQVQAAGLTAAERATLAAILRKVLGGSSVGADGSPSKRRR